MPRDQIVWAKQCDEEETYLRYKSHVWPDEILTDHELPTLEDLADVSDGAAENENYHELVGASRILAAILHRHVGREKATDIMREIAEWGGLHDLDKAELYAEFGIPEPWADWKLIDKEATT